MSPYLIWGIAVTGFGLLLLPALGRHRRYAVLSGVLAAPFGLLDNLFTPEYWSPPHLISAAFSIEGLLFSFGNGILVWAAAIWPFRRRMVYRFEWLRLLSRYAFCWALAAIVIATVWRGGLALPGLPIMTSALVALLGAGLVILYRRPDTWPLSLSGALGFGGLYAIQMAMIAGLAPDFASVWAPAVLNGALVFGLPVEELIWSICYGAVWAPAMAFGCDGRIEPARQPRDKA